MKQTNFEFLLTELFIKLSVLAALSFPVVRAAPPEIPHMAHCQICWIRAGSGEEPVVAWSEYQGRTFYFCSEACRAEFEQDPSLWSIDPVATTDTSEFVTSVPT